jgi:topoisomerase-4 subunit A
MQHNRKTIPDNKSKDNAKNNETNHSITDKGFLNIIDLNNKKRKIPNIEDGLTPIQRIILHVLLENNRSKKTRNIIWKCMDYFSHGNINLDSDIEDALTELVQKECLFIKGYGNFGVYKLYPPAHPDFTECEVNSLGREVFYNPKLTLYIEPLTNKIKIPAFFPAKLPVVLLIGVEEEDNGIVTRILPHNLGEVLNAEKACLLGKKFNLYPDFPSGGLIDVSNYEDGNGEVLVRAKLDTSGPESIVIRELPYGSSTESIIDSIESASKKGKIKMREILDFSDESVKIEIKMARGVSSQEMVKNLFAFTECQKTIRTSLIVMKDGVPTMMTVTEVIKYHVNQLVNILTGELEIKLREVLEDERVSTLERLFINNNIFNNFKKEKKDAFFFDEYVEKALNPFMEQAGFRKVNYDDIKHLLNIPFYRTKKGGIFPMDIYDSDDSDARSRIKDIKGDIDNITDYTINYLGQICGNCKRKTAIHKFKNT